MRVMEGFKVALVAYLRTLALAYLVVIIGITAYVRITSPYVPLWHAVRQAMVYPIAPFAIVPVLEQMTGEPWMDYDGFCRILNLVKDGVIEIGEYKSYGRIVRHQRAFTIDGRVVEETCPDCKPVNVKRYMVKDYVLYTTDGKKVDCGLVLSIKNFNVEYTCWALKAKAWKERYSL